MLESFEEKWASLSCQLIFFIIFFLPAYLFFSPPPYFIYAFVLSLVWACSFTHLRVELRVDNACDPCIMHVATDVHPCVRFNICIWFIQWMAAGESGASGRCAVRTARGSAAESARRRSPNMEAGCATGWRWLQTTALAASAHRVGNISISISIYWFMTLEEGGGDSLLSVPLCSGTVSLRILLFVIFLAVWARSWSSL